MFELNRLLTYDDESLISELRRVAEIVQSRFLTKRAFDSHCKAHSSTICVRFGNWDQALIAAGLAHRSAEGTGAARSAIRRKFTDDELVAELLLVSDRIGGKPVTCEEFNRHAKCNALTIRLRFGTWSAALEKAALTGSKRGMRHSDSDYFENLLTVWTHSGRQPTYGEMGQPPSLITASAYERKWGTWRKALLAFLEHVESDKEELKPLVPSVSEQASPGAITRRTSVRQARRPRGEDLRNISLGLRYEVLKRDRFRCVICGTNPAIHAACVLHIDHIVAFSRGGKTNKENLRVLCEPCNLGKGSKTESELLHAREG